MNSINPQVRLDPEEVLLNRECGKPLVLMAFLAVVAVGATVVGNCAERGARLEDQDQNAMNHSESGPQTGKENLRIRIRVDGKAVVVRLDDNPTSRDLIGQLPMEIELSDHARTEKIAYPPRKLDTQHAPSGYDPSPGDVTYYAPWGNLAIFYRDFGYAKGLVPLGVVESGLEILAALPKEVAAVIEHVEEQ